MAQYSSYVRLIHPHIRKLSTQMSSKPKNHYDALGITSKATQADVKSAYYKLSMVYHPDKNKDSEEAATKFRNITEAYEVLGNVKTRKLYDRGLFMGVGTTAAYDDPLGKFYKSRETKSKPPAPYGKETIYNFDEWSRAHYEATFQNDMLFKQKEIFRKKMAQQRSEDIKTEKIAALIGLFLILMAFALSDKDYDNPVVLFGGSNMITKPKQN